MRGELQHQRMTRLLEEKIQSGAYVVGARIPSERDLCALYGVSRITIRQAIADLVQRGLLTRHQGQGTFVATPRVEPSLFGYFSFTEALRAQGLFTSTHVLDRHIELAAAPTAQDLGLAPKDPVLRLKRLRLVDAEPFALEDTLLPVHRFPDIESADFAARSLYDILRADYGVYPSRARETFEPVVVQAVDARQLETKKGSAALLILRTTYDQSNRPIEAARLLIRGDRCRLLVELWANRQTQVVGSALK